MRPKPLSRSDNLYGFEGNRLLFVSAVDFFFIFIILIAANDETGFNREEPILDTQTIGHPVVN